MTTPVVVTIDENGISGVPYSTVLQYFQNAFQSIYGSDIVISADTQDGQLLGVYSAALDDTNNAAITAFNSFRPGFAVGAGLSSIVKINGISRKIATTSTVVVTLGGTVGTVIQNAYVSDGLNLNTQWFIVGPVTIPPSAVIDTQAICTTLGAVPAGPNTLTQIVTPIPGWQTVNNANSAVLGAPVETDAQLRRRQTKSTAIPAQTVQCSIEGNVLAVPSVSRAKVYENATFVTDPVTGIPSHSIAVVVQGTDPVAIATAIANTKPPGIPTYGNVTQTVMSSCGIPNTINYFQLFLENIFVLVHMKVSPSGGYSDPIGVYAQQAIMQYINNMDIGQQVYLGDIYSPANLDGDAATEATGLLQSQLDQYGLTYSVTAPYGLALARADMHAVGGPYSGNGINVTNGAEYTVGEVIWLTLEPGVFFMTTITTIVGNALYFNPPIPTGTTVNDGSMVYGVGNVFIDFYGAANIADMASQIQLVVST